MLFRRTAVTPGHNLNSHAHRLSSVSVWLIALLLTTATGWGVQAQTPYAPGGLFVHTTAFVPRVGHLSGYTAAFTQQEESEATYLAHSFTYVPVSRLQLSAILAYHQDRDVATHGHVGPFVKYQLAPDSENRPAFAIAAAYLPKDHMEATIAAVASHTFAPTSRTPVALHLGAKWGKERHDISHSTDIAGFVGLQVRVSPSLQLVGETSTRFKFDRASASSIGFMFNRPGIDVSLAMVNSGRSSRLEPFIGVGFPLGN